MTQKIEDSDRDEIKFFIQQHWAAPYVCFKEKVYYPHESQGFVVRREGRLVGVVTYQLEDDSIVMLTLNSTEPGAGIGSSLVLSVIEEARQRDVRRIWLITTNDNLKALGFYQRMGFRIVNVYPDAVNQARRTIKPEIPECGSNGLPIQDEIEMELILKPYLGKSCPP